jgi:hypothetical protein
MYDITEMPSDDLKVLLIQAYLTFGYYETEAVLAIKGELFRRGYSETEVDGLEVAARMYGNSHNYGPKTHLYFINN